ncbi:MAG: hypothetical protein LBD96_00405, partial [Treponema sp.]|nr:hypothetical protein [Treponema sp.]
YIVYGFDHSVENASGPDIRINGNAFTIAGNASACWTEPGTVWVSQDDNGDGRANDTWYELRGSLSGTPAAIPRYAVTYLRPTGTNTGGTWMDNLGNAGVYFKHFPPQFSGDLTFAGTKLDIDYRVDHPGYVDTVSTSAFDISNAMQADGSPADLMYIDFVRVQCALLAEAGAFGEISTELVNAPSDLNMPDPGSLLAGVESGDGNYTYTAINNSGYSLSVSIGGQTKTLAPGGSSAVFALETSTAYVDFSGGNVTFTAAGGTVTFTDRP